MTGIALTFEDTGRRAADDRRLSIAVAVSLVSHALVLAALRGLPEAPYTFAEGGVGSIPALQAVLAGPPLELQETMEPLPPQPMIDTPLLAPALINPVETMFGRTRPPTTPIPGGGPMRPGPASPEASVSVGTIADSSKLGQDYAAQLARRFPNPVQVVPMLLGTSAVTYPRAALESGIEGRFAAVVTVDNLGKAVDATLVVEDPLFGPVVLDALKKAEFAPAQYDGKPVPYWAIVEFLFTIGRPTSPSVASAPAQARPSLPRQPSVGR